MAAIPAMHLLFSRPLPKTAAGNQYTFFQTRLHPKRAPPPSPPHRPDGEGKMPSGSKNLRQWVFFSEQEGGRLGTRVNHKPSVRSAAGRTAGSPSTETIDGRISQDDHKEGVSAGGLRTSGVPQASQTAWLQGTPRRCGTSLPHWGQKHTATPLGCSVPLPAQPCPRPCPRR